MSARYVYAGINDDKIARFLTSNPIRSNERGVMVVSKPIGVVKDNDQYVLWPAVPANWPDMNLRPGRQPPLVARDR